MSCGKSELCIFDRATPQVVVENGKFEEIFPVNSIAGKSHADLEFNIVGSHTEYLDLNDTLLCVELKVVDDKGADYTVDAANTPSNYMFHTLWKDVILTLNTEKIEGGDNNYMHKALLDTILNYNTDTRNTNLTSIGYEGETARTANCNKSKTISLCGTLQLDFFDQPKYLIPGVNVNIKLKRNEPGFCIYSAALKPKIEYISARLLVRRVRVEPSVLMGHQLGLNARNAIYPIRQCKLVTYNVGKGLMSFNKDQIFGDVRMPKFILVTFQNHNKHYGAYTEKTGTYDHLKCTKISLTGATDYMESYEQDFESNYTTTYVQSMIRNLGHMDKNLNNAITMKSFKDLFPFFTFILAPDFDINQTQLPKQGNLRLEIKFAEALAESMIVLIYGIFDHEIQINKARTVLM